MDINQLEVLVTVAQEQSFSRAAKSDRKSTRLNSSHSQISYAVFCLQIKAYTSERQKSDQPGSTCGRSRPPTCLQMDSDTLVSAPMIFYRPILTTSLISPSPIIPATA